MTYILLLFAAYSILFLPALYWATDYYHKELSFQISESISEEAQI
jgi:hypothetical protein